MEKIILYKHKDKKGHSFYWYKIKTGHLLDNLVAYLKDIGTDPSWWLEFLDNPTEIMMIGNMQEIDKEGDKVFIGCQFRQDNEDRDPNAFETTIPELKRIIKEWLALLKEGPDEIIFTYENGKVKLTGI